MTQHVLADDHARMAFAVAVMRGGPAEAVSTDQLLIGLTTVEGTREVLDAAQITRTVATSVSAHLASLWASADGTGAGPAGFDRIVMADEATPASFTPAAAEAMRRAARAAQVSGRSAFGPADLLMALVQDPHSRAAEVLTFCGVDVAQMRADLAAGRPPRVIDSVPGELHRVRDMLLGRTRYPSPGWRRPLESVAALARVDYARHPMIWLVLETDAQAAERSHQPGTDDALLATAAMYDVVRHYPHLYPTAPDAYHGAELLNVSYQRLRQLADEPGLGPDPLPLRRCLTPKPRDIRALLRSLLADRGSRASHLLARAGIDPSQW